MPYSLPQPTPQLQLAHLKLRNRHGSARLRGGRLTWRWTVQPTPVSRLYKARVECDAKGNPDVFIDLPDIQLLAGGRKIPHLYSQQDRQLCLFLPGSGQWNASKLLANTIIPWTSMWLLFFEEWLWSDAWQGGGEHPVDMDDPLVDNDGRCIDMTPSVDAQETNNA